MANRPGSRKSVSCLDAPGVGTTRARRRPRASSEEARAVQLARYQELECFDRDVASRGMPRVAGVDEVGRGALAGPVVCAAVVLPRNSGLVGVDDSKRVDASRRDELFTRIVREAESVGIAFGHPDLIDRENILVATLMMMHRAVDALRMRPDVVLVDGRDAFQWPGIVVPVLQGDARSLAIAAASIVAKVARDRMMSRLHERYPQYNFRRNKGYGTKDHVDAISVHGAAAVHRRSFLLKIVEKKPTMF